MLLRRKSPEVGESIWVRSWIEMGPLERVAVVNLGIEFARFDVIRASPNFPGLIPDDILCAFSERLGRRAGISKPGLPPQKHERPFAPGGALSEARSEHRRAFQSQGHNRGRGHWSGHPSVMALRFLDLLFERVLLALEFANVSARRRTESAIRSVRRTSLPSSDDFIRSALNAQPRLRAHSRSPL